MTDKRLEDELRALAERLDPPEVPAADDVRRGRQRQTRQRMVAGGAALATAAVLAVGATALPGAGDEGATGPARGGVVPTGTDTTQPPSPPSPPSSPPPEETELPTALPTELETTTGDPDPLTDPFAAMPPTDVPMMVALRRAVAGHLDPDGVHISPREIRNPNNSGSSDGTGWTSIEQKIGWTNPGEDGQGVVTVSVHTAFDVDCGGHYVSGPVTTCTDDVLAGLPVTRLDDETFGESIAYRRPDGYVTTVAVDDLFGNNSLTPVSGVGVTDEQLAAVLTDPALDIPGHPAPRVIDVLSGAQLRDVARPVLGRDSLVGFETWTGDVNSAWWSDVRGPDGVVGEVSLSNGPSGYAVDDPCDAWYATRCALRTVEGRLVRLDFRRDRTGGGYDVTYDGPERTIWVRVSPDPAGRTPLPVDLAVRLATDARLQR